MMEEKRLIDAKSFAEHLERMARTAYPNLFPGLLEAAEYAKDFPTVDAVELPCKVGDTIYQVDANKIYPITIKNLIYDAGHVAFDEKAIGKSVFLTRKEAEAKLGGDGNG